jgi:hypothetical protein
MKWLHSSKIFLRVHEAYPRSIAIRVRSRMHCASAEVIVKYRTIRSIQFQKEFDRLPPPVAAEVDKRIRLLEANPRLLSRPAFAPLQAGRVVQIDVTFQGMDYMLDVVFKYGSDEETLHLEYLYIETM